LGWWRLLKSDMRMPAGAVASGGRDPDHRALPRPSSELQIADTSYRPTALANLLGSPVEAVHTRRLYEGLELPMPKGAGKSAAQPQRYRAIPRDP
jgi:hypothetical protein